jgi:predicted alpha/beta-fold hydrolase
MAINRTGFQVTNTGLVIDKDPLAQMIYTLDWSDWLETGDTVLNATWSAAARRNDPTPLVVESSGIAGDSTQTYVELSGGQADKTYIVTVAITTANAIVDRRNFRVNCVNRSA